MATAKATDSLDIFLATKLDGPPETYYSLWTITEEGKRDPAKVKAVLLSATRGLKRLGGRCRLYVTMGGPADLIGVAKSGDRPLNEQDMLALQQAIQASGILKTVFFKAFEFTQDGYTDYTKKIKDLSSP